MTESDGFHAIVLAAGAGSRFGGAKLTALLDGEALLNAALRSACAAPVASLLVVTGAHADVVEAAVRDFACRVRTQVTSIRCADHALGMAASLRCGLAAVPPEAAGAFIFLGDMPHVPAHLPARLLAALAGGAQAAAPRVDGRLGHPVLITRALFEAFSRGAGDGGGQLILRDLGDRLVTVAIESPDLFVDVDTPDDLAKARRGGR